MKLTLGLAIVAFFAALTSPCEARSLEEAARGLDVAKRAKLVQTIKMITDDPNTDIMRSDIWGTIINAIAQAVTTVIKDITKPPKKSARPPKQMRPYSANF